MSKTYGNTWWGGKWLDAFKDIDFSNRLTRGRSHADKGAVSQISIDNNFVQATVAGNQTQSYQVELRFSRFNKDQKRQLVDDINDDPLLLSKLLTLEMPIRLANLCENLNIPLFPSSWNDIRSNCSCPDRNKLCKHLAAILYIISKEIDQNPFLIFELHGVELIQSLQGSGFNVERQKGSFVKSLDLMRDYEEGKNKKLNPTIWNQIDFSNIKKIETDFLQLLSDNPTFYTQGDFKKLLQKAFTQLRLQEEKAIIAEEEKVLTVEALATEQIEILLDKDLSYLTTTLRNATGDELLHLDTSQALLDWIKAIPIYRYHELSDALRGLALVYQFTRQLLLHSTFIPQLISVGKETFRVRWLPAKLNSEITSICNQLSMVLPDDLVFYRSGKKFLLAQQEDLLLTLVNVLLSEVVSKKSGLSERILSEKVPALFFQNEQCSFSSFTEQSYPESIQLWLSKFFLGEKEYIPILQVEDAGEAGFAISVLVEDCSLKLPNPIPLSEVFAEGEYDRMRITILKDLAILTDFFPKIEEVVAAKGQKVLLFDQESFVPVLFKLLPSIRLLGVKVLLPKTLQKLTRPRLSMRLDSEEVSGQFANKNNRLGLDKMLTFEWKVAIGDQQFSIEDFNKMANQYRGIIRLKNEYVFFDEPEILKLITQLVDPPKPKPKPKDLLKAALTEEYEGTRVQISEKASQLIKRLKKLPSIKTPKGLRATLRPYQQRGYAWMYKNAQLGFGSLIGDDMGLGKTLQVITTLLRFKEDGWLENKKVLIIVPTTLLSNWEREISRFAPDLTFYTYHGANRNLKAFLNEDLLITTYGIVRSEVRQLTELDWLAIVIDESQHIKNPLTAQTKAVKKINAPIKIAMSGTPVENRLSEYWSVFDFTNKGYLGSLKSFVENFAKPIEIERSHQQMDLFRKVTAPFVMRRLKSDKNVIQDLPDKIEKNQYCHLTTDQAALYQTVVTEAMERIELEEGVARKGLVLKLLTSLKQVCNHPRQYLKRGGAEPNQSGKCLRLFDLLEDIFANQGKVLIFTQYQEMGRLLQDMIQERFNLSVSFLHGGVSRKDRDLMVANFQANRNIRLLILSLKAAGTGLNLTAANHVIHFDLWWNPAVEAQATDRAFRIGQQRNVMVHRFITKGSFEENIDKMLQHKKELANLSVASGESWIGDLSNKDLKELVQI